MSAQVQRCEENVPGDKMITLTINGKRIRAKQGETILQIAERKGIRIPTLCHHKDLTPYGGCRLCIVDVRGKKEPLTACTLIAENGMVIKTDTPRVRKLRKFTLQLILSEHPNACLICEQESDCANFQECIKKSAVTFGCKSCPQNNNCELQNLTREFKIKSIPFEFRYRNFEIERHDPFFDRDYNLCILCGRCIRACDEIRHARTLDFHHRGPDTMVGTAFDLPHLETDCQFCGACVDVCPTGALRDRFSRYDRPSEKSVKTTCMLCSIGCSIDLGVADDKVICSKSHNSQVCVRGRFGIAPLVNHPKRATKPMIKKEDRLVEVDWNTALEYAAQILKKYKKHSGFLFSPQLHIEAIDSIYRLAQHLECRSLTTSVNLTDIEKPFPLNEIKRGSVFIIVNTDMISDFSVLLLEILKRAKQDSLFVMIDAVNSDTSKIANYRLQPQPGKEQELLDSLFAKGTKRNTTGVSNEEIQQVKNILKDKKICLLYNAANVQKLRIPRSVTSLPLDTSINHLQLNQYGVDTDYQTLLNNAGIQCLYLIGAQPVLKRKYRAVIVQDYFMPESEFDVFLPAATFAEINGSVIDYAGRKKRVRRAIDPPGHSKPDDWIVKHLALSLDANSKRRKIRTRKRMSTPARPSAKVSKAYPLFLIVRSNGYGYRSRSLSAVLKGFARLRRDQHVCLNEKTLKKSRLSEDDRVTIIGKNLKIELPVRISDAVPTGFLLMYHHPSIGYVDSQPVRLECTES